MPSKADEARKIARKAKGIKEKRTIAYQGTEDRKDDEAVKELLQQMEQNIESEANFTATLRVGLDVKDDVLDSVRTSLETDGFRVMLDKRGGVYKYVVASWSN
jgi:hypothetical protein